MSAPSRQSILRSAIATEEEQKLFQHRDIDFQIWNPDFAMQQQKDGSIGVGGAEAGNLRLPPDLQLPLVMQRLNPEAEDFQPGAAATAAVGTAAATTDEDDGDEQENEGAEDTGGTCEVDQAADRHGLVSNQFGAFLLPMARRLTLVEICRPTCPRCRPPAFKVRKAEAEAAVKDEVVEEEKRKRSCQTQTEDSGGGEGFGVGREKGGAAAAKAGGGGKSASGKIYATKSPRFLQLERQAAAAAAAAKSASCSPVAVVRPQQPSTMADQAASRPRCQAATAALQFPAATMLPYACVQFVGGGHQHQHQPPAAVFALPAGCPMQPPTGLLLAPAHHLPWLMPPPHLQQLVPSPMSQPLPPPPQQPPRFSLGSGGSSSGGSPGPHPI